MAQLLNLIERHDDGVEQNIDVMNGDEGKLLHRKHFLYLVAC